MYMEEFKFLTNLYEDLYLWLTVKTPGSRSTISRFNYYDKNVWLPIKNKIIELDKKKKLTKLELQFLKCRYTGNAYRAIDYSSRVKGHVCPTEKYQSCSKTIKGIKALKLTGKNILIELDATKELVAIDVFELLCFMLENKLVRQKERLQHELRTLLKYEEEEEVAIPMYKYAIKNISVVDALFKAYNSFVSDKIEDFNSSFYCDLPDNILNAFFTGKIIEEE